MNKRESRDSNGKISRDIRAESIMTVYFVQCYLEVKDVPAFGRGCVLEVCDEVTPPRRTTTRAMRAPRQL